MKARSDEEIVAFVRDLWFDSMNYYKNPEVSVRRPSDGSIEIDVYRMYDAPSISFRHLKALSEFFETDNVGKERDISSGGCDTCDYGSRYGFTLKVGPK